MTSLLDALRYEVRSRELATSPRTHCARVLALLADGNWHLAAELYQLGCIAHSRIAELRSRGHEIECERCDGEGAAAYRYRLVSERCCAEPDPWLPPRAHRDAGDPALPLTRGDRALQSSAQLALEVAA